VFIVCKVEQERQCTYKRNLRLVRVTTGAVDQQYAVHFLRVFLVSVFRRATRMRSIKLSYVACPTLPYFSILSHKLHKFRKKVIEVIANKMRVLIFSTAFI
jgi:hypothetical protein